ncbi:MAG: retaining beta-glycosidase, partial [Verrucomicrobiales bacterium]|nr:retaining beta-glycosidase [Verrucomicrobiales bacterium]
NLFKEEVLWSNFSRDGMPASFDDWQGAAPVTGEPEVARAWHNARKEVRIAVKAGAPVKLGVEARAAVPNGFVEMARHHGANSPAHRAIARYRRGVNFGNYLEAPRGQDWGVRYSAEDFHAAAREGFDHVRIPMRWNDWVGETPEYRIEDAFYSKCDFMVTNALNNHLNVIVNLHHFDAFYKNPVSTKAEFFAIWKQIAEHYKSFSSEQVGFELLNEPMDKATTQVMNPILAEAIQLVRKSCPNHTIFVGPGSWNAVDELKNLSLPDNDSNLIVTVHCYDPFNFTHQGASWVGPQMGTKGVIFPGPPETPLAPIAATKANRGMVQWFERYNSVPRNKNPSSSLAFEDKIQTAHDWSLYYGRPIHFGEFGAIVNADDISRANWYREFRTRLENNDLAWAVWDWKAGFAYWDPNKNQPRAGLREALFGTSK